MYRYNVIHITLDVALDVAIYAPLHFATFFLYRRTKPDCATFLIFSLSRMQTVFFGGNVTLYVSLHVAMCVGLTYSDI